MLKRRSSVRLTKQAIIGIIQQYVAKYDDSAAGTHLDVEWDGDEVEVSWLVEVPTDNEHAERLLMDEIEARVDRGPFEIDERSIPGTMMGERVERPEPSELEGVKSS